MKKRSFFSNIYVINILGLILVSIILLAGVLLWLKLYTQHGKTVEVPDVKGFSVENAEVFFTKRNLNFLVVDSAFVENSVPGSIAETTPPVGSRVKEGRVIYLKINSYSPQLITIPDIKDISLRQSLAMLKSLGFENIETKMVEGVYKDLVIGLESKGVAMEAGQRVAASTPLSLLVSLGSGDISVLEEPEDSMLLTPGEPLF